MLLFIRGFTTWFKEPKDSRNISWTRHCKEKMKFYALSEAAVKNVLWNPKREETGVAEGTLAKMRVAGSKKRPQEIWIMYKPLKEGMVKIISAWRYPGITKSREPIPIPVDILKQLQTILKE